MAMYCNNFEFNESSDDFLLNAEPPESFAMYPNDPGPPGPPGPAGPGVAEGGTTGQLLAKASDEDYDTEWIDPPELDAGHVTYDDTETYEDGTVGKEISDLKDAIANKADVIVDSVGPAAIASFPDGANDMPIRKITATIEPVQDLHGYDNPWPGGGGKNLIPMTLANMKAINTAGTWNGNKYTLYGVDYTVNTDDGGNVESITVNGTGTAYGLLRLCNEVTFAANTVLTGCPTSTYTSFRLQAEATTNYQDVGSGVTIPANTAITRIIIVVPNGTSVSSKVFYPMVRLSTVSDATFAPYSNVCPISGWTGANVYSASGNLFDPDANPQKFIDQSGNVVTNGTLSRTTDPIYINSSVTKAWLKSSRAVGALCIASYDKNNNLLLRTASLGVLSLSQNIPDGTAYVRFAKYGVSGDEADLCANFGNSAVEGFPEYKQITSIAISWQTEAGTVYGGTLTINEDGSVVLTVDKRCVIENSSTGWTGDAGGQRAYKWFDNIKSVTNLNDTIEATSNYLIALNSPQGITNKQQGMFFGAVNSSNVSVHINGVTDGKSTAAAVLSALNDYFALNPWQFCYTLKNSQTYTLESIDQLFTKLGSNNIWVNTGSTAVTFPCDTKLYIDKKIAALA